MGLLIALFQATTALSRSQKRAVLLTFDMGLPPITAFLLMSVPFDFQTFVYLSALSGFAATISVSLGMPRIKLNAYGHHAVLVTAKFAALLTIVMVPLCQIMRMPLAISVALEFGMVLFIGCVGIRYALLNILLRILRQGQLQQRVLIYGAGDTGVQMALALRNHPSIRPIAFLDDDTALQKLTVAGLKVLSPARLETVLSNLSINRVLLAMPSASVPRLTQVTRRLMVLGLEVQSLPSFGQLAGTGIMANQARRESPVKLFGRDEVAGELPDTGAQYRGRVVLVSGAGGSVGSELCRQLIEHKPKTLVLFERSEIALYAIDRELRELAARMNVGIVPVLGSISDAQLARNTMLETRTETVFHAAAYKHLPLVEANPVAGLANNVLGTRIFAQAAQSAGVARFVLISTDKAVRPSSLMGATKLFAEHVVQDLANRSSVTQFSLVRFGNVLGSSGSVLPLFRDQIKRGGPITLTHEDVTRYFMSLAEAAKLVLTSGAFQSARPSCSAFVLDMGKPIRIKDLAERMILAEGLSVKTDQNPEGDIDIVLTGLRRGEKLHEDLLFGGPLLSTPHPKILRTEDLVISENVLNNALAAAELAVNSGDQCAARAVLDAWIQSPPQSTPGKTDSACVRIDLCLAS